MGENAKYNGKLVKIGTSEMMYYLRYEDRFKVKKDNHSLDPATCMNLFWRLPYPDEDGNYIGGNIRHTRGIPLYDYYPTDLESYTMQIHDDKSCLLVNVACYHGIKLPEASADFHPHWNGKAGYFFELKWIKNMADGLWPVYECRFCGGMWRTGWEDVLPHIKDAEMVERLKNRYVI